MTRVSAASEPLAIVGMSCRFPGAPNLDAFWRLMIEERHAITPVPASRFDGEALYASEAATPGRIMTKWGGWLTDIESFDASFFGMSPREVERLDPQQRLLLELSAETLADAGQRRDAAVLPRTGVFVGIWQNEYESRLFRDRSAIDFYMTTGSGRSTAAGRLSHVFRFGGPSLTVDTACSSALVALHLACQSVHAGECEAALVAAANIIVEPFITIAYSQSKMMAPDGRCKFGDSAADGYVRSEGAAALLIKPLARAVADGDRIHAVIAGSAVNSDAGASGSLGRPSADGQREMLRRAFASAGVAPSDIDYVEAHGTGTRAGDPVEIGAIAASVAAGRPADRPCLIGSVKTNIGHTEAAAGLAGLLKLVLAMRHETIPASLHFTHPNPQIPWETLPVRVVSAATPWPRAARRRIAGVTAFGISGTNAHVVLGEPPVPADRRAPSRLSVLLVSGHTPASLDALALSVAEWLESAEDVGFEDVAYTTAVRRDHGEYRAAIVADSKEAASAALRLCGEPGGLIRGQARPGPTRKVAFVFPGQGSQWIGMARQLLSESAFADQLRRCDAAVAAHTGWSVIEELHRQTGESRLDRIDVVQPVLFSVAVSLSAFWRACGVHPHAVIGHSMGEVAAACVAGALTLEDAARVICRRSALLRRTSGRGAMAVVELSLAEAQAAVAGFADRVSVAVSNSRRSSVLSGDPSAIDAIVSSLEQREVFCRRIKVDVASHSPQMDELRTDLLEALHGIEPLPGTVPLYSTVTARIEAGGVLTPEYWVRNLREPVRFAAAVDLALQAGIDTFVEMSPHPLLTGAVLELAADAGIPALALGSGRRDENDRAVMLASLASLHCAGESIDWRPLFPHGGRVESVPAYQWQRERFWYDHPSVTSDLQPDLLGPAVRPAAEPGVQYRELDLAVAHLPFLADHKVRGAIVVPAAFFVALATEAVADDGASGPTVSRAQIGTALVLPPDGTRRIQLAIAARPSGYAVRILSTDSGEPNWLEHATVEIAKRDRAAADVSPADRCAEPVTFDAARHSAAMARRGLVYGPAFQLIEDSVVTGLTSNGTLVVPRTSDTTAGRLQRQGCVLDAGLQLALAALPETADCAPGDTYVPVSMDVAWETMPEGTLTCTATLRPGRIDGHTWTADIVGRDPSGTRVVEARDVVFSRIARERDRIAREASYRLTWLPVATPAPVSAPRRGYAIVGDHQVASAIATALRSRGLEVDVLLSREALAASDAGTIVYAAPALVPPRDAEAAFLDALSCCQTIAARDASDLRLWLVTARSAAVVSGDVVDGGGAAALWGLRSVVAAEHRRLRISCLDVDPDDDDAFAALARELCAAGEEDEIALRGGQRYVRRLSHGLANEEPPAATPAAGRAFRAVNTTPGRLEGLSFEAVDLPLPGAGEIAIAVEAAALNFMNVMSAFGIYPGYPGGAGPLGIECAGRVTAIGEGVTSFAAGDAVMAFARHSMASHAIVHERLAARIPEGFDLEQAAALPVAYLTAHYALVTLARLRPGQRVLVHSATGGVGLAALAVARRCGAVVIATAGSPAKRDRLRAMGIAHVGDSRSLEFVDLVRTATDGAGVDVVLNSLTGEAIDAGLSVLRSGGRFVEIGKRDIYDNRALGLLPFRRNLSYFAVDLDALATESPSTLGDVLDEVVAALADRSYPPLPVTRFDSADLETPFRRMSEAQHVGKLVVSIDRETTPVRPRRAAINWASGVYLVTGGTGGLGVEVARWMVDQGARRVVLTGRRSEDAGLTGRLAPMRAQGALIDVVAADVSVAAEVRDLIARIDRTHGQLTGIVHAAGVLRDATILATSDDQVRAVFAPKVDGAINLSDACGARTLEFFVTFSSVAAFLGLAGQANYAAANAVLDALAAAWHAEGRPAISIGWGPWSEVGLAAAQTNRGARLTALGLESLSPQAALDTFGLVLERRAAHAVAMQFAPAAWRAEVGHGHPLPLLSLLAGSLKAPAPMLTPSVTAAGLREVLQAIEHGPRRRALIEEQVQQLVARVLKLPAPQVETTRPLRTLGLDSLMGLELRNHLEVATGQKLPATVIWNYPTVVALAAQLAERMGIALEPEPGAGSLTPAGPDPGQSEAELESLLVELESLSDEEARRLLADGR